MLRASAGERGSGGVGVQRSGGAGKRSPLPPCPLAPLVPLLGAVLFLWVGVALAASPLEVTGVKIEAVGPSSASLLINADGLITNYESFSLPDPPRLVIQIPNAVHAILQPIPAKGGPIARIRSSQYREVPTKIVRVVLDLTASLPYRVEAVGDQLKVLIGELVAEAPPPALAPAPPPAPAPAAPPVVEKPPVPEPAPVVEAPKPAEVPEAPKAPGVPPVPIAEVPEAPKAPPRISMDFKDADLGNILRIIAEVSGKNIVAGEEVKGKVTVRLTNVEWRQALDIILKVNNFGYEEVDNIIRVASLATLQKERAEKEKLLAEAEKKKREAEEAELKRKKEEEAEVEKRRLAEPPPDPKTFAVNFAKVAEIAKHFERLKKHPKASIIADERTSTLIVRDEPSAIAEMEKLLKQLDVPTPQVLIEARIVEASRTFTQSLGITWGGAGTALLSPFAREPIVGNLFGTVAGAPIVSPPITSSPTVSPFLTSTVPLFVNFPAIGPAPAALGIMVGSLTNRFVVGAQLSAAETEGRIRTLSAPKVTTLDNQEAEMKQGTQVPFTTIDASGRTVVSFIDAFIRLKVTPHITPDKRVSMKVEAERSFPGSRIDFAGGFSFPINTRKATTNILVPSGGTIVIGGLLQSQETVSEDRVPFLSRIPFLGFFFKRHNVGPDERIELLIFLTPTVLETPKLS